MFSPGEQQPLLTYPCFEDHGAPPQAERFKRIIGVWRNDICRVLESQRFHIFVIALIVIDAACVLADLGYTILSNECPPSDEAGPAWLEALGFVSLTITTLFLIEIPTTLLAFGTRFYIPFSGVPHAALHLFDTVIIVTTFVLEFVLKGRQRELAGLLITLRLWRLVKLVGGIAVGAAELEEETANKLEETKKQLQGTAAALVETKRQLDDTLTALGKGEDANRKLRDRVAQLERLEAPGSEGYL